tara:strand:- start:1010 stop:1729 length:720 start_codon:yes stop_codon:yes gene_type:complete
MDNAKNIKISLAVIYILIISIFLWFFFKYFSIEDFTSYELIKSNRDILNEIKNKNLLLSSVIFFLVTILWVLLLGFASPIFLIGGFIFGKWLGTFIVLFGLSAGATILYFLANFFIKDFIYEKFSYKFIYLVNKFKKNELIYFIIYRAVGGIPFFIQNLLPLIFNIKIKNYFYGSVIGLAPQLFIGVSLGSGINNIIDDNDTMPNLIQMILIPDIYFPILGLILILIITFFLRKTFFKK